MAAAHAVAVVPDSNVVAVYLVPCSILAGLALGLCGVRIYTRVFRTYRLYLDDVLVVLAEIFSLANLFVAAAAASHGWGHPLPYLSPTELKKTQKLLFANQTLWIFTIAFVRISVACSLLRFGNSWRWKGILYALIVLQLLTSSGWLVVQFFQCRPLRSFWEPVADAQCWDRSAIVDYGWFSAAFYCTMDLILALLPIQLLRLLNRSVPEKILIGSLMATGLLATGVAGAKMTTFNSLAKVDPIQGTVKPSMWAKLEEEVGIIAACMPALKSPAERCLRKIGVLSRKLSITRPSFVTGVTLSTVQEVHRDTTTDREVPKRNNVRVDSLGVRGEAASPSTGCPSDQEERKRTWEAV